MKIEQLVIEGFGKLRNQKVRFDPDRINLMVEDNEYGKSTIAEAISAALYGFRPRERTTVDKLSHLDARRPLDGGTFKLTLDLSVGDRRLRITRDFLNAESSVIDLVSREDVTANYILRKGDPRIGEALTGLSCDQFQQTCFVAHHALDYQEADTDLKQSLERVASSSRDGKTAAEAIAALQKGLRPLPGAIMGDKISIDTEIGRIEKELSDIGTAVAELEKNWRDHERDAETLASLQRQVESKGREKSELENFCLAALAKEFQVNVTEQEEIDQEIALLKKQQESLEVFASFPAAIEGNLVGWHAQLEAKMAELQRIERLIAETERSLDERQAQIKARFFHLAAFVPQDLQDLMTAKSQLVPISSRLFEIRCKREAELESLRQRQITPARYSALEAKLSKLDPAVRQEAIDFPGLRAQKLAEAERLERSISQHSGLIVEIDRTRKRRKALALSLLVASVIAVAVFVGLFFFVSAFKLVWFILMALSFGLFVGTAIAFQRATVFRSDDRSKARLDLDHAKNDVEQNRIYSNALERKAYQVAASLSVETPERLGEICLEYLRLGEDLKEFWRLANELESLETQTQEVQSRAFPYLDRAGRALRGDRDVTEERIGNLCHEMESYFAMRREIDAATQSLTQQLEDKQGLTNEIQELTNRLTNGFREADIKVESGAFDAAFQTFRDSRQSHETFKRISGNLPRLESKRLSAELLRGLQRELVKARKQLANRSIENLLPEQTHAQYAEALNETNSDLHDLNSKLTEVRLRVSRILDDYAKQNEELLERQAVLEARLQQVTSYREAVDLARTTLETIASDIHREWSMNLNQIYDEMLTTLDSPYVSVRFADDLSLAVETIDSPTGLQMRDIQNRLSLGAREQLFLLERLAISRYLSNGEIKLPLILDDPMVTSDDDRFEKLMRFIIETLPREHQVLIFSCHKTRHEWLREQLGDVFVERVRMAQLEPI